jgi:hypothetical protein
MESVATFDDEHMGTERAEGKNKDSQWKRANGQNEIK